MGPHPKKAVLPSVFLARHGVFLNGSKLKVNQLRQVGLPGIHPAREPEIAHHLDGVAHLAFHLSVEHPVVGRGKLARIHALRGGSALFVAVFLVGGEAGRKLAFKAQHRIHGGMGLLQRLPHFLLRMLQVLRLPQPKIIILGVEFGQAGFPQAMDAVLVGVLAVVVGGGMQRHVAIGNVVPQIGGKHQNAPRIALHEGFGELEFHAHDPPGHYAVGVQRVFGVHGHGIVPVAGQLVGRAVAVGFQVNVVPHGLARHRIAPPVRIDGVFGDENDVVLVKAQHFRRQAKHGHAVDVLVRIKTPAKNGMVREKHT